MRVLLMELNRISSHLVAIATGGMEIGALTVMTIGFRERELVLDLLRADHRPADEPRVHPPRRRRAGHARRARSTQIRDFVALMKKRLPGVRRALQREPDLQGPARRRRLPRPRRLPGARHHRPGAARRPATPWDLRKTQPYCGYETYDFDVVTWDTCDAYGRFRIRLEEMWQSLRIVEQCARPAAELQGEPVMVADKKIAWPSPARGRLRRHGQLPRPHPPHHGRVDGGADPPLQAGDRGLPGAGRPGLRPGRVARAASSARTSSPTAAPAPTGRTSATRRSRTCRRRRR